MITRRCEIGCSINRMPRLAFTTSNIVIGSATNPKLNIHLDSTHISNLFQNLVVVQFGLRNFTTIFSQPPDIGRIFVFRPARILQEWSLDVIDACINYSIWHFKAEFLGKKNRNEYLKSQGGITKLQCLWSPYNSAPVGVGLHFLPMWSNCRMRSWLSAAVRPPSSRVS